MIGDVLTHTENRDQLLVADQPVQQLRVVQHRVIAAQLRVFAAQRVEAVRAGHDDLAVDSLDAFEQVVEGLHVLRGELLEQELVAGAAGRVTVAGLTLAEHQVLHPGDREQFGDGLRGLLGAILVGAGAADPEQVLIALERLDVLAVHRHVEVDLVDPVGAVLGVLAPRIALGLKVFEQHAELAGELGLHHHLIAAHVDDVVDVLDIHRALFHAGATGGAGPQHVGVDDAELFCGSHERAGGLLGTGAQDTLEPGFGDVVFFVVLLATQVFADTPLRGVLQWSFLVAENVWGLGEQVVAQVHDHELRGQRLSGVPCRALRLAASALRTRGEVEVALPGEVLDLAAARAPRPRRDPRSRSARP